MKLERTEHPKDYGKSLEKAGFRQVSNNDYAP
jgi:hypothetical protein